MSLNCGSLDPYLNALKIRRIILAKLGQDPPLIEGSMHYLDSTDKLRLGQGLGYANVPASGGGVPPEEEPTTINRLLIDDSYVLNAYEKPILYLSGLYSKLYIAWMDGNDPYYGKIKSYNYATESWGADQTITAIVNGDDHRTPSIGFTPDKHLIAFYDMHSTGYLKYRRSVNVEDETSWSALQQWDLTTSPKHSLSYPYPCCFSDKLCVFFRSQIDYPSDHDWVMFHTFANEPQPNGTDWTITQIINNDYGGDDPYLTFQRIGNNIFMVGSLYVEPSGPNRHLFFMYSPDKGVTWKLADGTVKTLPVALSATKVVDETTSLPQVIFGCLDENGKPIIITAYRSGGSKYDVRIAQFSGVLGQSGSWSWSTVVDSNNNAITNRRPWLDVKLDPFYDRPVIWVVDENDYYMKRYTRMVGETNKFELKFTETNAIRQDVFGSCFCKDAGLPNSPYEMIQGEGISAVNYLYVYGLS